MLCSLPLTDYPIPQAKTYGKDGHVIGVHVAQQAQTLSWTTAEHDAMIEDWQPAIVIDDDIPIGSPSDIPMGSPSAGSSSARASSSQDAVDGKRKRQQVNKTQASYSSFEAKSKKTKRENSPPAKRGKEGAASKRGRKSGASDPANDIDMEKYEEKRVAELKKTYEHLIDERNHERIANLELIGDAASAGESLVSSHSPVLYSTDIFIQHLFNSCRGQEGIPQTAKVPGKA